LRTIGNKGLIPYLQIRFLVSSVLSLHRLRNFRELKLLEPPDFDGLLVEYPPLVAEGLVDAAFVDELLN
jgi:hypothetical protein